MGSNRDFVLFTAGGDKNHGLGDIRRKDFNDVIFNDVIIRPLKATLIVNSLLEVPVRCPRSINSRPDDMTHVTYPDMKFHEIHEFRRFLQRKYSTLEIYL